MECHSWNDKHHVAHTGTAYARCGRRAGASQRPRHAVRIDPLHRLADAGIERSVGSIGDSYDNALAESVNGLYKTEVIRKRGPWRNIDTVEMATLEWVDWFNNRRLLEPIGYVPPVEFEQAYFRLQESAVMGAALN